MGGAVARHEPYSMDALLNFPESYQIFRDFKWIEYFQKVEGLDEVVEIEFSQKLNNNQTWVRGLQFELTEEVISQVNTFPLEGWKWFNRKINDPSFKEYFLEGEEKLEEKGRGINRLSLPHPWVDVTLGLIKYITFEGRSMIVFNYHFPLLDQIWHHQKINIPFYLLGNIKNMVEIVKTSTHPEACVTNHGLIKLIVLDSLGHKGKNWEEFKKKRSGTSRGKQTMTSGGS